jgi:hypothetical protein
LLPLATIHTSTGPELAIAVGEGGAIARLAGYGSSSEWTYVQKYVQGKPDLSAVAGWGFTGVAAVLWAVGRKGTVLKSVDQGQSWTDAAAAAGLSLSNIDLTDIDTVSEVRTAGSLSFVCTVYTTLC